MIANSRRYDLIAPGASSKDNNHYFGYLGASWDATGKLRGNAKLGYQQKILMQPAVKTLTLSHGMWM